MSPRSLVVEADGGSRGNPGPAGYGAVVRDAETGDVIVEVAEAIGTATNNVAEYRGLIAGLRAVASVEPGASVEVRMDSKLVVEQMSGRWKIKHADMRRLALEARDVLPPDQVTYTWVPRSLNAEADRLANEAMDAAARGKVWTARLAPGAPAGPAAAETGRTSERPDDEQPVQTRPANGYAGDLTPPDAYRLLAQQPDAVLVDCRTRPEWAFVGVPDLTAIGKQPLHVEWVRYPDGAPNAGFVQQLREAGAGGGAPLVFICRSGGRSVAAARAAQDAGLGPAYNVLDGFEGALGPDGHRGAAGWRASGLPWTQS